MILRIKSGKKFSQIIVFLNISTVPKHVFARNASAGVGVGRRVRREGPERPLVPPGRCAPHLPSRIDHCCEEHSDGHADIPERSLEYGVLHGAQP